MLLEALNRPWHATLVGVFDQVWGVDRHRHMITVEVAVILSSGIAGVYHTLWFMAHLCTTLWAIARRPQYQATREDLQHVWTVLFKFCPAAPLMHDTVSHPRFGRDRQLSIYQSS